MAVDNPKELFNQPLNLVHVSTLPESPRPGALYWNETDDSVTLVGSVGQTKTWGSGGGGGFETGMAMPTWTLDTPSGWLECDGSPLTTETPYTALRQKLIDDGRVYGDTNGDGTGDPLLPNPNGRHIASASVVTPLGTIFGSVPAFEGVDSESLPSTGAGGDDYYPYYGGPGVNPAPPSIALRWLIKT